MKARNIFALLGLSVAMGVGAFAFASTAKVKETKAADTTVYCKMTYDWWKADGAAIGAYYWKSSDDTDHNTWPGTRMTPVETDTDVWKFVIPDGYDKVIFTRINGSGEVSDWGAQTENLDIPTDENHLFTITSETAQWKGEGHNVAGSWGTYEEPVPEEKSWMVRFQFNAGSASQEFPGEFENRFTGAILHLWGDGLNYSDAYVAEKMFTFAYQDYYAVNVSFTDSQVVRGAQWEVTRDGAANAQSVDIQKFGTDVNTTLDKDTPYAAIGWQYYDGDWAGEKFKLNSEYGTQVTTDILLDRQGGGSGSFTKDPVKNVFKFTNYCPNEAPSYIGIHSQGNTLTIRENLRALVTVDSWRYLTKGGSDTTLYLATKEYYDFEIGNASFAVKKHVDPHASYIYYVSNSAETTVDYIYSWDETDTHQFGDWPGTAIGATAAWDVTGVVKFEGTAKKIYRIPVTLGYPTNECYFMWNNGAEVKSDEFLMVDGAAYWWAGGANLDAGASLDLIFRIEALRNAVPAGDYKQFSICGISKADAATVVNTYNNLSDASRTMVNTSLTYTYKGDGTDDQTDISFRDIVVELGKIAEIEVVGSPRTIIGNNNGGAAIDSTTLIAVISIIALVSISSIAVLVVIKKRKHN